MRTSEPSLLLPPPSAPPSAPPPAPPPPPALHLSLPRPGHSKKYYHHQSAVVAELRHDMCEDTSLTCFNAFG